MPVDAVKDPRPVLAPRGPLGQRSDAQNIRAAKKRQPVFARKPLALRQLLADRLKLRRDAGKMVRHGSTTNCAHAILLFNLRNVNSIWRELKKKQRVPWLGHRS